MTRLWSYRNGRSLAIVMQLTDEQALDRLRRLLPSQELMPLFDPKEIDK